MCGKCHVCTVHVMCLHVLVLSVLSSYVSTCLLSEVEGVLGNNKEVTGDDLDKGEVHVHRTDLCAHALTP